MDDTWARMNRPDLLRIALARQAGKDICPACGDPSASAPAEVYCVDCATAGWEEDAERWREHWRTAASGSTDVPKPPQ